MTAGKQVKIVVRGYYSAEETAIEPFVEIWVKQRKHDHFFSPIALGLPSYGFQGGGLSKIKDQAMQASGISDQQFEQAISEFRQITISSALL